MVLMRKNIHALLVLVGCSVFVAPTLRAQDAKFAADNLKYSRDFYSKVHFVAIASLPASFKYDRYPSGGPERIQCDDGTYARQRGRPWRYLNDKMRTGLPIDYPERNRYVMTFALREDWGRTGEPVDKETARKLDGWIKFAEAALSVTPANAKLLNKSETTDSRTQWVFEVPSEDPNGVPARFTFRKPSNDKNEKVLLHEFSGPLRLEGDKVVSGGATDTVTLGFGYMMSAEEGYEVSEFVWEEMQQAREEKAPSTMKESLTSGGDKGAKPNPKKAELYYAQALSKQKTGDWDGALADYTRAIELNPRYAEAYNNRGNIRSNEGDADGAIADFDRALEIDPQHTKSYNNRGSAKEKKGDLAGAIADYTRAIELDPQYAHAYFNRGTAESTKGDLDGAIADLTRAIELDPKDPDNYGARGIARKAKHDLEDAIADFDRAIKLNPKDAVAYDNRGGVLAEKKQYRAAIKDIQKAIELDSKNGEYYLDLGWYQLFNRKPREAIAASLKALELAPDDAVMIKGNLAHGYLFDNQFEKAKAIYLENKDAKIREDKRTFSQAVLDDFKKLEEAGVTHPDMEKIEALLAANASPR
jgi:tetratricopeptide (TPR) repeat protein